MNIMRRRGHTHRPGVWTIAIVAFVGSLMWIGCVSAADMIFRGSDGSHGSITQLGDDQAIYRDGHGTVGPIRHLGGQGSPVIITPQGEVLSGTVTPFESPMPPNHITPALAAEDARPSFIRCEDRGPG